MSKTMKSPDWKGYTLKELQFERVLNSTLIDIERDRMRKIVGPIVDGRLKPSGLVGKVVGALSWIDYLTLGITVFRKIRRMARQPK